MKTNHIWWLLWLLLASLVCLDSAEDTISLLPVLSLKDLGLLGTASWLQDEFGSNDTRLAKIDPTDGRAVGLSDRQILDERQLLQDNPFVSRIYSDITFAERQDFGGLGAILAIAPFLRLALVAVFAFLLATVINAFLANAILTFSGRGDIPDDWEYNYSVWMQQLQYDLDEAWDEN